MSCDNPTTPEKEDVMLRRPKFDRSKKCVKCKVNWGNVVVRHAVFCKTCFFPFVTTKFKRALDPYINAEAGVSRRKSLKASGNLLLGFSGGLNSTVLLDLVNQCYVSPSGSTLDGKPRGGKDHPRNGQVWNKVRVCYVETCAAFPGIANDRTDDVRKVVERLEPFEFIPVRIEHAFDWEWWAQTGGKSGLSSFTFDRSDEALPISSSSLQHLSPTEAIRQYLSSLPTQTAIATAVQNLIRFLLLHIAQATGSSHLLLGTSLTSLSIAHISSIAQGGGFAVREEAQEEWSPASAVAGSSPLQTERSHSGIIRIIRPLRDVGMKECAIWAWWRGLYIVGGEQFLGGKQGIGALTRDFIVGLEKDYPSTVSTIAKTCAKVEPKEASSGACILCERPAQRDVECWKSRISIRTYSSLMDPHLPLHVKEIRPPPSTSPISIIDTKSAVSFKNLAAHLCYSCHTTLTSRSNRGTALISGSSMALAADVPVPLPVWVNSRLHELSEVSDRSTREAETQESLWRTVKMDETAMRNVIEDFLLDDG
ncbi:hypothetical protein AX17_002275 [Amanita inopinata Kibby_2008]|nr:hypothetical protein AX17_002275 [Amanita inopinata Kibby_2008]